MLGYQWNEIGSVQVEITSWCPGSVQPRNVAKLPAALQLYFIFRLTVCFRLRACVSSSVIFYAGRDCPHNTNDIYNQKSGVLRWMGNTVHCFKKPFNARRMKRSTCDMRERVIQLGNITAKAHSLPNHQLLSLLSCTCRNSQQTSDWWPLNLLQILFLGLKLVNQHNIAPFSFSCFLLAFVELWSVHNKTTDDRCHENKTSFCLWAQNTDALDLNWQYIPPMLFAHKNHFSAEKERPFRRRIKKKKKLFRMLC